MNMLSQLFGGMTQVWLNVAFIVCVFAAVIFRPGRINNISLLQIACVLFAMSLMAPGVGVLFMENAGNSTGAARSNPFSMEITTTMKVLNIVPSALFSAAFLAAVMSLMPTGNDSEMDA